MSTKSQPADVKIGQAIRHYRGVAGISLEELGKRCGVTYQQVQKYESGANRVSASRLLQIAEALGCTVADLLSLTPSAASAERDHNVDRLARRLMSFPACRRDSLVAALSHALDAIDDEIEPMQASTSASFSFEGRA